MLEILVGIYIVAGYWAAGRTIFANTGWYGDGWATLFIYKLLAGTVLGVILIPIAIIKVIVNR